MRLKLALLLLITVGCLAWVLDGIDPQAASTALANTAWWTLVPMFAFYLIAHALRTWRLGVLLGQPVPFWALFAINSIGFLAINVVPLRFGELVRPYLLMEQHQIPLGRGLAAIVLERLLDMAMLLFMLIGVTWWVELPQEGLVVNGIDLVGTGQRLAGTVVLLGALFGGALLWIGEPAIALIEKLPLGPRLSGFARRFREGIIALIQHPLRLIGTLLLSIGLWGTTLLGVGVMMWGFPGIPSSIGAVWTTWSITLSGMTVLPTPGFFGGYELFCVSALWLLDVERDLAGTFALTLHLSQFAFTCGLGGAFVLLEGWNLRSLVRDSQAAQEDAITVEDA